MAERDDLHDAPAWASEPDGPGLWWRDDRDGMPAYIVTVVSHGGVLMMHVVGSLLPLPIGRRWARCVPPTAEILAPGELTRAELRAQAWREGAEAMRSEARRLCDENVELVEGVLGMRPTDHLVLAAGDQGEIRGIRRIAREVHALPVPPCPEVSR